MTRPGRNRAAAVAAAAGYVLGVAGIVLLDPRLSADAVLVVVTLLPTVVLGLLVTWRRPGSPVGPALVVLAAAACLTWVVEDWGASYGSPDEVPGAALARYVSPGAWVWQLTGLVLLCAVFPNGRLPGRRWAAVPWAFVGVAVVGDLAVSVPSVLGYTWDDGWLAGYVVLGLALIAVLAASVASLVVRYRRGSELERAQLRWLVLGAGSVPLLLAAGWVAEAFGASVEVAYTGFVLALVLVLPAAVAVAILRHDLLDVDRLLTGSVSWLLSTVVAAGAFAAVVLGVAQATRLAVDSRGAVTAAAFAAALVLLPAHRRIEAAVGRLLDRERTVTAVALRDFVHRVRDGGAEPEEVEDALRRALGDPGLRLLLVPPGGDGYVDLTGTPADLGTARTVPLTARDSEVGVLVPGRQTARQLRRVRDAALEVRLPIEVSRLRVELRGALEDARASRARLVEGVAEERRRLERDLHDGAQQRIVAVGMRLRSAQRRHPSGDPTHRDLDAAVLGLEEIVAELRRLAHGVRPSRLDDGLGVAIRDLVGDSPIPVTVQVGDVAVSEPVATTAYYVVAECLANTLKHAAAGSAHVRVERAGARLSVQVSDDGRGGATTGFGLTSMGDRVAALGGRLAVSSPAGGGTTVRAEL